jgi:hypothetical protein
MFPPMLLTPAAEITKKTQKSIKTNNMKTIGWLGDFLKILLGHAIIWSVYYTWRMIEKNFWQNIWGNNKISLLHYDDIISSKCVVKIDVEGAEVSALESGRSVFSQGLADLIIVEILDEYGFDCFTQGVTESIKTGVRLSRYIGNIIYLRRESLDYNFMKEQYFKLS